MLRGLCQTSSSDLAGSLLIPDPRFPYSGNKVPDSRTHLLPPGRQETLLALPLATCTRSCSCTREVALEGDFPSPSPFP